MQVRVPFAVCVMLPLLAASGCGSLAAFRQSLPQYAASDAPVFEPGEFPGSATESNGTPPRQIAGKDPSRGLVSAPTPFAWKTSALSAGGRLIQTVTIGNGERQTIVVGSLGGHDPLAIQLNEQLARYLHQNELVLGGVHVTVIRSGNPDGEASSTHTNADGIALHRAFPEASNSDDLSGSAPEVRFLLNEVRSRQPDRVIHLRTISDSRGVVAANRSALSPATELANWLQFGLVELPGQSATGTLERFLAESDFCEVMTLAIPDNTPAEELWARYGDSLLNMLLEEDFATRWTKRNAELRTSADRRNRKGRSVPMLDQPAGTSQPPASPSAPSAMGATPHDPADDLPPVP
ncbi:MAG: hypothetical protein R3C19_21050 [Planctomycetaceae bacterium]